MAYPSAARNLANLDGTVTLMLVLANGQDIEDMQTVNALTIGPPRRRTNDNTFEMR